MATILDKEYGTEIFHSLCKPEESQLNINLIESYYFPWLPSNKELLVPYQLLSSASIKANTMQLHAIQRPCISKEFNSLASTLTSTFIECGNAICCYSEQSLAQLISCHYPFCTEFTLSQECMISGILCHEFGETANFYFTHNDNKSYSKLIAQQALRKCRNDTLVQQIELKNEIIGNWPQIPTWTVIMDCLRNYQMQLVIHNL